MQSNTEKEDNVHFFRGHRRDTPPPQNRYNEVKKAVKKKKRTVQTNSPTSTNKTNKTSFLYKVQSFLQTTNTLTALTLIDSKFFKLTFLSAVNINVL